MFRFRPPRLRLPTSIRHKIPPSRGYLEWGTSQAYLRQWTGHARLQDWVMQWLRVLTPARVHLCDGTDFENETLLRHMVHSGSLIQLNPALRPNSYLARSAANDVARVEENTFICSENKIDAGFTNNWMDPEEADKAARTLFTGAMTGRTLYVIPFCMGPLNSEFSQIGVQLTDSPYVVVNMRIMTRMGTAALKMLEGDHRGFVPCIHSLGVPLQRGVEDSTWPCNGSQKRIMHFPEQRRIWSFGSGYGGNALLGKKCFALRIASAIGREEGWLAEHMLIVGITNPQGVKKYIAAAFPSACGKTNLAMLKPDLPGWKVETVGDDIAWLRVGKDGRLWAVNPEAGFFGVAPGTNNKSNPNAMATLKENVIFTNVALTPEGDVWWEGLTEHEPSRLQSWLRTDWYPDSGYEPAHPNSRFTAPSSQCPTMDPNWERPEGVPIDAIIFGGRRSTTCPLVYQSLNWQHGVFVGATVTSETTAAAAGKRGVLRNDPFAMRPFCGYNVGDYFNHWLSFTGRTDPTKLPKIFHVNWFKKNAKGKFLWPGFGDNLRVLEWILKRCDVKGDELAIKTPIGFVPTRESIDIKGLEKKLGTGAMEDLLKVDANQWLLDQSRTREFLSDIGPRLPQAINDEFEQLQVRLQAAVKRDAEASSSS